MPPEKLEERDYYFTSLATRIQMMREANDERVVLMGHSMGNRNIQYFLQFVKTNKRFGQAWIDENIHAFFALGPPFLGATKTVRAVVSGDCMGLEAFLTNEEGRTMARGSASLPWLFPIQENLFPDIVAHVRKEDDENSEIKEAYEELDVEKMVKLAAPNSWDYFSNFYEKNPNYWKNDNGLPPITEPPPVENLWVLYGKLQKESNYKAKSIDLTNFL